MQVLSCYFSPAICCWLWLEINQGILFYSSVCISPNPIQLLHLPATGVRTSSDKRSFLHPLRSITFTSSADGEVFPVLQNITNELERALPCRFAFLPERGFSAGKQRGKLEVVLPLAHLSCLRKAGRHLRGFRHDWHNVSVSVDTDMCRWGWWCVTERRGIPGGCWGTEQRQWCAGQGTAAGTGNGLCIAFSGDAKNPYKVMRSYVWPWIREYFLQGKGIEVAPDLDLVSWTWQSQKGQSAHFILLPLPILQEFRTLLGHLGKSGGKWVFPSSLLMPYHVAFSSFPGNNSPALSPPSWLPFLCRINNHHRPISWGGPRTTHTVRQDYFALSNRRHHYSGKSGAFPQPESWSITTFALQRLTWSSAGWPAA